MKTKLLSIILCVLMTLTAAAPAALAEEDAPPQPLAEEDGLPDPAESPAEEPSAEPAEDGGDGEADAAPAETPAEEAPLPAEPAEEEPPVEAVPEESLPEEPLPEESAPVETPAEETPLPAEPEEEEPAEPAGEEPAEPTEEEDPAEPAEEEPAADAVEEMPLPEEEGIWVDGCLMDPEDPLYARYGLQLDGAVGNTYSDYTPRALKNGETLYRGIDVSVWQGKIDWNKVKADGVDFVFIRAGYRSVGNGKLNIDSKFAANIRGAKAAGLQVGVYIFSQAITVAEAVEEADYLMSIVQGYSIDLPLVFDLEHYSGGRFTNAKLSRRAVTDMCVAFCQRIEQGGYASMVYSNPSMLNNEVYPNELGRLWLAHVTRQSSYSGRDYEYWQCSFTGRVDGIDGDVDLDYWFKPSGTGSSAPAPAPAATPAASGTSPFSDVKEGAWYCDTVLAAYQAGVVKGATDTTFNPGGTATRGQVVTMIHRMEGLPAWTSKAKFTDLTQTYYQDAVYWAAEKGVVNGYSDTSFGPGRAITREELVSVLYRMAGSPAVSGSLSAYTDAGKVQSWAKNAMIWATENKIITGYADNTLRPQNSATRAEVCTILMRYAAL